MISLSTKDRDDVKVLWPGINGKILTANDPTTTDLHMQRDVVCIHGHSSSIRVIEPRLSLGCRSME